MIKQNSLKGELGNNTKLQIQKKSSLILKL